MKKQMLNEVRRMQKIAGLLKEEHGNEQDTLTIVKIEPGRDTGMTFGAIGKGYEITLSDGSVVESDDEDLLDRYEELRTGNKLPLDQLNKILAGREYIKY